MKIINPTNKNLEILVDDDDYEELVKYNWSANKQGDHYSTRREVINNKPISIIMHRKIMNSPKDMVVHHIDGNGLNNQKTNLKILTHSENLKYKINHTEKNFANVNTKLKKAMVDAVINSNQFAKQLGITPQTFSAKINGKMSFTVRQYKSMAEYLGVTIDEII